MEYTPYYIHYYHLMAALKNDYSNKPKMIEHLTKKIQDKLSLKLKEVHEDIRKKYMLESDQFLHDWISHFLDDPLIKKQVDLFDINDEKVFVKVEPPDFELHFPPSLT